MNEANVGDNVIGETPQQNASNTAASSAGKYLTNSRLYAFIEAADPTQSFFDLSLVLDEPVEELVSMATYLQSWGLSQIVSIIYSHSCYRVHEMAPLSPNSRLSRIFDVVVLSKIHRTDSPDSEEKVQQCCRLPFILALFNGQRSMLEVMELMPEILKDWALDAVVFLLRYHMLTPVNKYVINYRNLPATGTQLTQESDPRHTTNTASTISRNVSFHLNVSTHEAVTQQITHSPIRSTSSLFQGASNNRIYSTNRLMGAKSSSLLSFAEASIDYALLGELNDIERSAYFRIAPYIQQKVISSKNVFEIMLYSKVSEKMFNSLLDKLPHLGIIVK